MKTLMILGGSILQLPAIKTALEMGLKVIVVDQNKEAIGFGEPGVIKAVISTTDIENVLKCAIENKIDGIITLASDLPMRTIAKVSNELGLIGISEETAMKATNKLAMRKALEQYNVPIPAFFYARTEKEFLRAVNDLKKKGFKCIVKPADNSASRGIELITDYSSEKLLLEIFHYSRSYSHSGEVLIEEFMEGPEVSVETISMNGICQVIQITDKITTGAPYFVEMGHTEPSTFGTDIQEKIKQVAIAANMAIGNINGPSHTEIKVTVEGPKIVELGARLGGDNITTHLVPLSTGVDMVAACIDIALGNRLQPLVVFDKASAIRYIRAPKGKIIQISGVDSVKKMSGVKDIVIVHGVGEYSTDIKNSNNRIGYVISQSKSVSEAVRICESAINNIQILTIS